MEYSYIVTDIRFDTPDVMTLTLFTANRRRIMPYKPGQYATVSFDHHGPTPTRCFSMASSPQDLGWLQFSMRIGGDFTKTAAKHLKVGAPVKIQGPFGGFVLNPYRDRAAVLVAGGIGITPFMSILRAAAQSRLQADLLLVYCCSDQAAIPYRDEIIQLSRLNPMLHVVFVISQGPVDMLAGQYVLQGRLKPAMLDALLGNVYRGRTFFLCGPAPLMSSVTAGLVKRQVSKRRIVSEDFSRGVPPQTPVLLGRPSQVYVLTALGLLVGTAAVFNQDMRSAKASSTATDTSAQLPDILQKNGRETDIDKQISQLQNKTGGASNSAGQSSTPGVNDGNAGQTMTPGTPGDDSTGNPSPASPTPGTSRPSPLPTPPPAVPVPPPQPSPPPSAPPVAPVFNFTANTTTINRGASVTLTWGLTNAATVPVTCTASGGWNGTKDAYGSQAIAPTVTTTFTLTCGNRAGNANRSVTVNVIQPTPAPTPPPPAPTPTPPPAKPPTPPPPPPSSGGT